jgi:prolyl-tRNA synthetase
MRQSTLFTKTRKESPKDEVAKNADLLIRAGFIHKEMAGVYSYLPLGLRVLNKIVGVIRKEMESLGASEVSLTAIQAKDSWEKTDRWDDDKMDVWFKTALKNGTELGLAPTHEEPLTALMKDHIRSYRDLPRAVFQFQTKFRNETRAKSGIMRGREFLMKDLYSFSADAASHDAFYEKVKESYIRIFKALGIGDKTFLTRASGGSFSKFSHEFQTLSEAGEDTIYISPDESTAINVEILETDEAFEGLKADKKSFEPHKSIEVGNIFSLGTRFSEALELTFLDQTGKPQPVVMGSYGIGPGRVMGTIVETHSDEKGIVWPAEVAPFAVHLISVSGAEDAAEEMYASLTKAGVEVLFDDRDVRPGEKFADADLIGIPVRVVVSEKTLAAGGVEFKKRTEEKTEIISQNELISRLSA